jgi:hypothetical protein
VGFGAGVQKRAYEGWEGEVVSGAGACADLEGMHLSVWARLFSCLEPDPNTDCSNTMTVPLVTRCRITDSEVGC